jgi:hypothetical protein
MAKDTIYIGVSLIGSAKQPISLAVAVGEDVFRVNFLYDGPQPRWWTKYPKEWEMIREDPQTVVEGLKDYRAWVGRYHGRHIAVTSSLEFWELFNLLISQTGKCSFGTNGYLDVGTLRAMKQGNYSLKGRFFNERVLPWEEARERWKMSIGWEWQRKKLEEAREPLQQPVVLDRLPAPRVPHLRDEQVFPRGFFDNNLQEAIGAIVQEQRQGAQLAHPGWRLFNALPAPPPIEEEDVAF